MVERVRRHINAAMIVAIAAFIFAMTGGALAVTSQGGGSHANTSAAAKKKGKSGARGPRGPRGPAGPVGPQGPAGAQGPAGPQGLAGTNGVNGKDGTNGVSVTSKTVLTTENTCNKLGGSEFVVAENKKTTACNGAEGKSGAQGESVTNAPLSPSNGSGHCEEGGTEFKVGSGAATYACNGSPWTDKSLLPKGATEAGEYSLYTTAAATGEFKVVTISFPIRLAEKPVPHRVEAGQSPTPPCTGSVENPGAEAPAAGQPPNLCIFESEGVSALHKGGLTIEILANASGAFVPGVAGTELIYKTTQTGEVSVVGSYAITG